MLCRQWKIPMSILNELTVLTAKPLLSQTLPSYIFYE